MTFSCRSAVLTVSHSVVERIFVNATIGVMAATAGPMSPMNQQAPFFPNGVPGLPAGAGAAPFGAGAAYVPGMPPELASLVAAGRIEPLTRGSIGPGPGGGGSDGEPGGRDRSSPFGEQHPSSAA